MNPRPDTASALYQDHSRRFAGNKFVYPVLSRRSGGISLGVNLNPDKVCNFDCIYCQVDRRTDSDTRFVELDRLLAELDESLTYVTSGEIFQSDKFAATPAPLQRLNDIAFSGDGEPTTHRNFDEVIAACAEVKRKHGLDGVKMVLITNASMFHREHVRRGLETLARHNGEIWAKLDAGTEAYYQRIERTTIPFQRILDNITWAARQWPIVIQSMFMRVDGEPPSEEEQLAFCDRLSEITAAGGQIKLVQIYTVARAPAESYVSPLADHEVNELVQRVREQTGLPAVPFYGTSPAAPAH
jgi:wyosine [tRNA(Phe)-imidazoG37] synthetase (radical SAM superfamily)